MCITCVIYVPTSIFMKNDNALRHRCITGDCMFEAYCSLAVLMLIKKQYSKEYIVLKRQSAGKGVTSTSFV